MFLTGLGTATPATRYTQRECWEALAASDQFDLLDSRARAIARKVLLGRNGIVSRHLALDSLQEVFGPTPDVLHARFARHAPALAADAATRALVDASLKPEQIDAVLISTCTGYLCPGLTSYVAERLGLRTDVLALDLVGQGCGAAVPNWRTAEVFIASKRCRHVLSICVEVCSAAFYLDNDAGVMISACLFGDAAGAAVFGAEARARGPRIEWLRADSALRPADRDRLRFEQREGMLRNILTVDVPELAARAAQEIFETSLREAGLRRDQIAAWLWHPGGRDVLAALERRFALSPGDLRWSAGVLERFGNVSSASLYLVMEAALAGGAPKGHWWLSSFGAGFSCHGVLLKVS